mmetsp:Transcript_3704/g.7186  ORF Transcript_3704/g.7186 Transcript_3704/m.7186 type:complete len:248 (+) Transcript_3704:305-1048(+)
MVPFRSNTGVQSTLLFSAPVRRLLGDPKRFRSSGSLMLITSPLFAQCPITPVDRGNSLAGPSSSSPKLALVQNTPFSLLTRKSAADSAPRASLTYSTTAENTSSSRDLSLSLAIESKSINKSGNIPIRQPIDTPTAFPKSRVRRTIDIPSCARVSIGSRLKPVLSNHVSTTPPTPKPSTSLTRFPSAAAAMVDIPNAIPRVRSNVSPATIMTALSMIPNTTNSGIGASHAYSNCRFVGLGGLEAAKV